MFFNLNENHKINLDDVSEYYKSVKRNPAGVILSNTLTVIMKGGRSHTLTETDISRFLTSIGDSYESFYNLTNTDSNIDLPNRNLQSAELRSSSMSYDPKIS